MHVTCLNLRVLCISESEPPLGDQSAHSSDPGLISLLRKELGLSSSDLFSMTVTDYDMKPDVRQSPLHCFGFSLSIGASPTLDYMWKDSGVRPMAAVLSWLAVFEVVQLNGLCELKLHNRFTNVNLMTAEQM